MSPIRQDWLERLLGQLPAAFAAIESAHRAGHLGEARALIRRAAHQTLGMDYGVLTSLDVLSTAEMLSHPARVQVLARLVGHDARILQAQGRDAEAAEHLERARMLEEEAIRMSAAELPVP